MYRCELCGAQVPERVRCTRVVVATRRKEYHERKKVYLRPDRSGKLKWFDDPGGAGAENEREVKACGDCARIHS